MIDEYKAFIPSGRFSVEDVKARLCEELKHKAGLVIWYAKDWGYIETVEKDTYRLTKSGKAWCGAADVTNT